MKKIIILFLCLMFLGAFIPTSVFAVDETKQNNPSQLFDIAMIVDQSKVIKVSDLKARVTFISFGSEDTPVELTFKIIDNMGKEYYNAIDHTIIQTEGVFNKTFKELNLADGKYILILKTVYNKDITDEFKQDIEILNTVKVPESGWRVILGWIIVIICIFLWVFLLFKRKNKSLIKKIGRRRKR